MANRHHAPSFVDLEDNEDGPTLSVAAVRLLLGLSRDTTRELMMAGDIRSIQIGRHYKALWRSVRDYCFRIGALPLRSSERGAPCPPQDILSRCGYLTAVGSLSAEAKRIGDLLGPDWLVHRLLQPAHGTAVLVATKHERPGQPPAGV